jgi:hypothetical protein
MRVMIVRVVMMGVIMMRLSVVMLVIVAATGIRRNRRGQRVVAAAA